MGSYSSIMGNSGISGRNFIGETDMYTYMEVWGNPTLKKIYYTALGRERWGSFHVNNVNYDSSTVTGDLDYFLSSYY